MTGLPRRPWRIIKLGGSLLDLPNLPTVLEQWYVSQSPLPSVLMVGGGVDVDRIRQDQQSHLKSEVADHWACIDIMSRNAWHVARTLSALNPLADWCELAARLSTIACGLTSSTGHARAAPLLVFDVASFLRTVEPQLPGTRLPHNWDTTSDSIAARLAEVLYARELVLLKSTLPQRGISRQDAVTSGLVDRHFDRAAMTIPIVRCVQLRQPHWPECVLA